MIDFRMAQLDSTQLRFNFNLIKVMYILGYESYNLFKSAMYILSYHSIPSWIELSATSLLNASVFTTVSHGHSAYVGFL